LVVFCERDFVLEKMYTPITRSRKAQGMGVLRMSRCWNMVLIICCGCDRFWVPGSGQRPGRVLGTGLDISPINSICTQIGRE
jgi:hypothetical protein